MEPNHVAERVYRELVQIWRESEATPTGVTLYTLNYADAWAFERWLEFSRLPYFKTPLGDWENRIQFQFKFRKTANRTVTLLNWL